MSVVSNQNSFWSLNLNYALHQTEAGQTIGGGSVKVWTGSTSSGQNLVDNNCQNWSDGTGNSKAAYGLADQRERSKSLSDGEESCEKSLPLYCISH